MVTNQPLPNTQINVTEILGKKCRFFFQTTRFVMAFNGYVRCAPRGDFDIEMEDAQSIFLPKLVYPTKIVTPPEISTQDDVIAWVTLQETNNPDDLIIWG